MWSPVSAIHNAISAAEKYLAPPSVSNSVTEDNDRVYTHPFAETDQIVNYLWGNEDEWLPCASTLLSDQSATRLHDLAVAYLNILTKLDYVNDQIDSLVDGLQTLLQRRKTIFQVTADISRNHTVSHTTTKVVANQNGIFLIRSPSTAPDFSLKQQDQRDSLREWHREAAIIKSDLSDRKSRRFFLQRERVELQPELADLINQLRLAQVAHHGLNAVSVHNTVGSPPNKTDVVAAPLPTHHAFSIPLQPTADLVHSSTESGVSGTDRGVQNQSLKRRKNRRPPISDDEIVRLLKEV